VSKGKLEQQDPFVFRQPQRQCDPLQKLGREVGLLALLQRAVPRQADAREHRDLGLGQPGLQSAPACVHAGDASGVQPLPPVGEEVAQLVQPVVLGGENLLTHVNDSS